MISLQVISKTKEKAVFLLKDTNPGFANAVRRLCMTNVPVMAIEEVEFHKNSSVLYDEIVAHRLGLVPLKTDLKTYNLKETCKCEGEGCARCTVQLSLKAKGPCTVYAGEIKSKDPVIKPLYPKMPIVKLIKGQELVFIATATLGLGQDHAKYNPCLAVYKGEAKIEINDKKVNSAEEIAAVCGPKCFDVKGNKLVLTKNAELKCHLCNACVDKSNGAVKVQTSNKNFVFTIESWEQLSPKQIMTQALEVLEKKTEEFTEALKA